MKSVLIAIQPYWVFLIIAKIMGWEIDQEKTVEVRKGFPKDPDWNKKAIIYCSKNKQSFNRIPKKYQPLMERFLGRVVGEFVCDRIDRGILKKSLYVDSTNIGYDKTCIRIEELEKYLDACGVCGEYEFYGWHITDLVVYDKPKELGEFKTPCKMIMGSCYFCDYAVHGMDGDLIGCNTSLTRPPQSWCYVEDLGV